MTRGRAELALVLITLIWGSTFIVVKQALVNVSPLLFLALRFSLAALALLAVFRHVWRFSLVTKAAYRGGLLVGAFLFLGFALQTFGLRLTSASKSAFLTGLATPMVPLLGALVYRTRPRPMELAGVGLATAGMGLMTLHGSTWSMGLGDLLTVGCAAAFAGHIVALGYYSRKAGFEHLAVFQVATAAVLASAMFWWAETPQLQLNYPIMAAVLLTGLLATALAFSVQSWAQRHTTSTRTALIFMLEPVFAWITSWLVAGETLSGRGAAGAGMILAGVLLAEVKPLRAERHP